MKRFLKRRLSGARMVNQRDREQALDRIAGMLANSGERYVCHQEDGHLLVEGDQLKAAVHILSRRGLGDIVQRNSRKGIATCPVLYPTRIPEYWDMNGLAGEIVGVTGKFEVLAYQPSFILQLSLRPDVSQGVTVQRALTNSAQVLRQGLRLEPYQSPQRYLLATLKSQFSD